jgi:hypothetical protein
VHHLSSSNMRRLIRLVTFFILVMALAGCTSVKRLKSAAFKGEDHSLVDMALFDVHLDGADLGNRSRNLWDLSPGAQTELIQDLSERYPGNEQFLSALNRGYLSGQNSQLPDFTRLDLRMVFTISRKRDYPSLNGGRSRFSPADRIEYLKFTLEIAPGDNLRFTGWNRYMTEYGEVGIADLSFSRSLELEAEYTGERVEGRTTGLIGRSEKQVVKSRYLKVNGAISEHKIEIEEEGTREIDLTGNVVADVSIEFEGFPERITYPAYASGEGGASPEVMALHFVDVRVPKMENAPDSIMCRLEMEYVYRHVESGWKTFHEWDDRVDYYTGRVSREFLLFHKYEYVPPIYCIGSESGDRRLVKVTTAAGPAYPLQFGSYAEAKYFLDWLTGLQTGASDAALGNPVKIGEYLLLYDGMPLEPTLLPGQGRIKVLPAF